jgi:hypothetical protein
MLWALLCIPMLHAIEAPRRQKGIIIALAFAFLMAPQNLIPNGLAIGIRIAHMLEIILGNFIFGVVMAFLLDPAGPSENRALNEKITVLS